MCCIFFFFNDTPTTEIYTLSLHDALPIYGKTVVFEVSKDANKIDIKRAIEKLLGAKVADVRTAITRRSEEHTSELQSRLHLVCRLLLEKKKKQHNANTEKLISRDSTVAHL